MILYDDISDNSPVIATEEGFKNEFDYEEKDYEEGGNPDVPHWNQQEDDKVYNPYLFMKRADVRKTEIHDIPEDIMSMSRKCEHDKADKAVNSWIKRFTCILSEGHLSVREVNIHFYWDEGYVEVENKFHRKASDYKRPRRFRVNVIGERA